MASSSLQATGPFSDTSCAPFSCGGDLKTGRSSVHSSQQVQISTASPH